MEFVREAKYCQEDCEELLATSRKYVEDAELFELWMKTDLDAPLSPVGALARGALDKDCEEVKVTLDGIRAQNPFLRTSQTVRIRRDLGLCNDKLDEAYLRFINAKEDIIIRMLRHGGSSSNTDLCITGAKPLRSSDIRIVGDAGIRAPPDSFWNDFHEVVVDSERLLARMYYGQEAEATFLRETAWLGKMQHANFPLLYGYCMGATIPFIVLRTAHVTPLQVHLLRLVAESDLEEAVSRTRKYVADTQAAADFLVRTRTVGEDTNALRRAVETGDIVPGVIGMFEGAVFNTLGHIREYFPDLPVYASIHPYRYNKNTQEYWRMLHSWKRDRRSPDVVRWTLLPDSKTVECTNVDGLDEAHAEAGYSKPQDDGVEEDDCNELSFWLVSSYGPTIERLVWKIGMALGLAPEDLVFVNAIQGRITVGTFKEIRRIKKDISKPVHLYIHTASNPIQWYWVSEGNLQTQDTSNNVSEQYIELPTLKME
ncbi:hypothetical protein FRB99_006837 [Tulasnella sp. 403]|nr:hypothetical protein FRB99_006837 [Tulasnella sp. 403]